MGKRDDDELADKALARSAQGLGGMTFGSPQRLRDETIDVYLRPLVRNPARTHAYALALENPPMDRESRPEGRRHGDGPPKGGPHEEALVR